MLLRELPRAVRAAVLAAQVSEQTAARHPDAWGSFWARHCGEQWIRAVVALLGCLALPHGVLDVPEPIALEHVPPRPRRAPGTTHYTLEPVPVREALRRTHARAWTLDLASGVLACTYRTARGGGRLAWYLRDPEPEP